MARDAGRIGRTPENETRRLLKIPGESAKGRQ
jgi:hypothetical protein